MKKNNKIYSGDIKYILALIYTIGIPLIVVWGNVQGDQRALVLTLSLMAYIVSFVIGMIHTVNYISEKLTGYYVVENTGNQNQNSSSKILIGVIKKFIMSFSISTVVATGTFLLLCKTFSLSGQNKEEMFAVNFVPVLCFMLFSILGYLFGLSYINGIISRK